MEKQTVPSNQLDMFSGNYEEAKLESNPQEQKPKVIVDTSAIDDTKQEQKPPYKRAEWCFQFQDLDPIPFAAATEDGLTDALVLNIPPTEEGVINFAYKGLRFKLFSREMSEENKALQEKMKKDEQQKGGNL